MITKESELKVTFQLKDTAGTVIDKNDDETFDFKMGTEMFPINVEKKLLGKKAGEKLEVTLPPAKAYGEYDDSLCVSINVSEFGDMKEEEIEMGMQFIANDSNGHEVLFYVVGKEEGLILVDANHPLAGQDVTFVIDIISVD